ncbi:hypothetical protein IL306_011370 [Fusarium sp. DS 682]|nr:hypothetical protein IL306_011370 [Fusarium sp. DS 682]
MRLGMAYNSYTQTMCIDNAVEATAENTGISGNPLQKVTFSTKLVERVSDVVDTMNISRAAAIKSGIIGVHGNTNAFNDAKLDKADISLLISVQVINQTFTLKDSARYLPIEGMDAGSPRFNEAFGDSYISGFIFGGLFVSVISFRCMNPKYKDHMMLAVKKMSGSSMADLDKIGTIIDELTDKDGVHATLSMTWTGGGQIQDFTPTWDVGSVVGAAARFPYRVAENPQRTWAILTKYKANRSYNEWAVGQKWHPVEYDSVAPFTAELFNNFMQYRQLFRKVKHIIAHQEQYSQANKPRAIPLQLDSLLALRAALQNEMNKIIALVDMLAKQPWLIPEVDSCNFTSKDELVQSITDEATAASPTGQSPTVASPAVALPTAFSIVDGTRQTHQQMLFATDYSPSESSSGFGVMHTPDTMDFDSASLSGRTSLTTNQSDPTKDLNQHMLIDPKVWAELLPVKKPTKPTINPVREPTIKILGAVCGIHDVTKRLQEWVGDDCLRIPVNKIDTLEDRDSYGDFLPRAQCNLAFIYRYKSESCRICSIDYDENSTETVEITGESEYPEIEYVRAWGHYWATLSVVYGGRIYNNLDDLRKFCDSADYSNKGGWPYVRFDESIINDGHWGKEGMTGVVFYHCNSGKGPFMAVSVGPGGCLLDGQRQLANLTTETIKEVEVIKEVVKAAHGGRIILGQGIKSPRK